MKFLILMYQNFITKFCSTLFFLCSLQMKFLNI